MMLHKGRKAKEISDVLLSRHDTRPRTQPQLDAWRDSYFPFTTRWSAQGRGTTSPL